MFRCSNYFFLLLGHPCPLFDLFGFWETLFILFSRDILHLNLFFATSLIWSFFLGPLCFLGQPLHYFVVLGHPMQNFVFWDTLYLILLLETLYLISTISMYNATQTGGEDDQCFAYARKFYMCYFNVEKITEWKLEHAYTGYINSRQDWQPLKEVS